jgi:hypothetical protein
MPESREDSVYLAKLAEQAERYEGTRLSFVPLLGFRQFTCSPQRWLKI